MLNKHLLRFRRSGDKVKPSFVDCDSKELLGLASRLLEVYDVEKKPRRGDIDEQTLPLTNGFKDIKLAKGLNKLIQDRSEFSHVANRNLPELREEAFAKSAAILKALKPGEELELPDFQQAVSKSCEVDPKEMPDFLYGDLPENECLISVKKTYAKELLERYNNSLVQSLLLHSQSLTLHIEEPDPSKMRRLFKYLKFFRLLARIYVDDKRKKVVDQLNSGEGRAVKLRIEIDGPASLLENTSKYGVRLASFFPAICALEKWKVCAEVKLERVDWKLSLDQSSGLVCHYRQFSAYVPEEVVVFHHQFKEKVEDWQVAGNTPFINVGGQELIFPDLCFQALRTKSGRKTKKGKVIWLELFHRWHSHQLLQRLDYLAKEKNLIVGIDRALYNKPAIKDTIDESGLLDKKIFLFRDFPAISKVKKLLDQLG